MLNERIKSATKNGHQELEKEVIYRIKAIENNKDYAELLKYFYSYFLTLEASIEAHLPSSFDQYCANRRNAEDIKNDLELLGFSWDELPLAQLPTIENKNQAIGALYVLEGSIMGGPYIVKMLQQKGIADGFNFFKGYGEASGEKWAEFSQLINTEVAEEADMVEAISAAQETFQQFGQTFKNTINV